MGSGRRLWLLGALTAVIALSFGLRISRGDRVVTEDRIIFRDNDTVRRLVRLDNLTDPGKPYPFRNPADGHPEGSVIHWTLPMDAVLIALDPLVSWAYPQARRFEAAAIWSGMALGMLALLAFALLAIRWLGPPRGLLATALYASTYPVSYVTSYGNGDHQSLQHLCAVLVLLGFARLLAGQVGRRTALLVGVALGLGLWVSAETAVLLHLLGLAAFVHLLFLPAPRRPAAAQLHLFWAGACLVVAFVGDRVEHPGQLLSFEWDRISGFQLYQISILVLFFGLTRASATARFRRLPQPLIAAGAALGIGLLVLLLTPLRGAFSQQLELFQQANRWAQVEINEYRPLFFRHGAFLPLPAVAQLSWLVFLVPLFAIGCAMDRSRIPLLVVALGLFVLTCLEIKLGHLFAILYPWLIITGGAFYLDRFDLPRAWRPILGCAALGCVLLTVPVAQREISSDQAGIRELTAALRELIENDDPQDQMRSVLATWDLGAMLMYEGVPVVATGYHRNLAGIHDSLRLLFSTDWETRWPILRARKIRWIVSQARPQFMARAPEILPELPILFDLSGTQATPRTDATGRPLVLDTLQYQMMTWSQGTQGDPHLRLVWESAAATAGTPHYRIWRVVYPEER